MRILNLLAHMQRTVEACKSVCRRQQANTESHTRVRPAALAVKKFCEHERGRASRCGAYQDDNHDGQEDKVAAHANDLEWRQKSAGVDVQEQWNEYRGPHEECSVPTLRLVVWVVQNYQTFDLRGVEVW